MEIYGLPQPIDGSEIVTILQVQNGKLVLCSMPLSQFSSILNSNSTAWASGLSSTKPTAPGVVWNDGGVVSIS